MTIEAFIQEVHQTLPNLPSESVLEQVQYKHNGKKGWGKSDDVNADFREDISSYLLTNHTDKHRTLIRYLLEAEIEYARRHTILRETMRELTHLLYRLGHIEDIPLLFEAKMDSCFDVEIGLNVNIIFGKDKDATTRYYQEHPHEKYDIAGELACYDAEDYYTPAEYLKEMDDYHGIK